MRALPKATPADGLGVAATVTCFHKEIKWSNQGPSVADRYILSGVIRGYRPHPFVAVRIISWSGICTARRATS